MAQLLAQMDDPSIMKVINNHDNWNLMANSLKNGKKYSKTPPNVRLMNFGWIKITTQLYQRRQFTSNLQLQSFSAFVRCGGCSIQSHSLHRSLDLSSSPFLRRAKSGYLGIDTDSNQVSSIRLLKKCRLPGLQYISIADNPIRDVETLCQMNNHLMRLDLEYESSNTIGESLSWISKLKMTAMKRIYIEGNNRIKNQAVTGMIMAKFTDIQIYENYNLCFLTIKIWIHSQFLCFYFHPQNDYLLNIKGQSYIQITYQYLKSHKESHFRIIHIRFRLYSSKLPHINGNFDRSTQSHKISDIHGLLLVFGLLAHIWFMVGQTHCLFQLLIKHPQAGSLSGLFLKLSDSLTIMLPHGFDGRFTIILCRLELLVVLLLQSRYRVLQVANLLVFVLQLSEQILVYIGNIIYLLHECRAPAIQNLNSFFQISMPFLLGAPSISRFLTESIMDISNAQ